MKRLLPVTIALITVCSFVITGCDKKQSASNFQSEKTHQEVCVEHNCTHADCPMYITAKLRPGERIVCPVCGEYITSESGKLVKTKAGTGKKPVPAQTSHGASQPAEKQKILFYRNPMNPQVTSPVPLKDQMGMDYVPVYADEAETAGPGVKISKEKQQLIGVTTAPVKAMPLKKIIRASGKIAYDPELFVTQEEFLQALDNEERVKESPLQDIIDRSKTLTDAARRKLKLLGMSDEQITQLEKTRKVDASLYLPAKGENVWAYVAIYEYEISFVRPGLPVEIEALAYPGEIFNGSVVSLNPVLDPATRTNQIRVSISNPDNKLKPEMFVNARIKVDLGERLAVPESAVMDTGVRKMAYLLKAENLLEAREVRLGQRAEGYYEVLEGLSEGDTVVTSGNFLIDSESRLQSAVGGAHQH